MTIQQHVYTRTPIRIDTQAQFNTLWKLLSEIYPDSLLDRPPSDATGISIILAPCASSKRIDWSWAHTEYFTNRPSLYKTPIYLAKAEYKR